MTLSYQIRHKEWGVFQGEGRLDERAPVGFWHSTHPGSGLCKFETRERAQRYVDLICRFVRGTARAINESDFIVEPFSRELAAELGGEKRIESFSGDQTPSELSQRIADLEWALGDALEAWRRFVEPIGVTEDLQSNESYNDARVLIQKAESVLRNGRPPEIYWYVNGKRLGLKDVQ